MREYSRGLWWCGHAGAAIAIAAVAESYEAAAASYDSAATRPASLTNDLAIAQLLGPLSAWSQELPPASLTRVGLVVPLQLEDGEHYPIRRLVRLEQVGTNVHACASGEWHRLL